MKTNKISDAEFIAKYNVGFSHQELSAHFCISLTTVQVYVKRLKLPKHELIDKIDKESFTKMWNEGCSLSIIGRKFGLCGTTISHIARKMQLKERELKRSTKQAYTFASEPNQEVPISTVPIPTKRPEAKSDKTHRYVVPPTLAELRKRNQQAEIAKAERDYKIYRRDCGYMALQEETD